MGMYHWTQFEYECDLFLHFYLSCVYACTARTWKSGGSLRESVLFSYIRFQGLNSRFSGKCLYLLSHPAIPENVYFDQKCRLLYIYVYHI